MRPPQGWKKFGLSVLICIPFGLLGSWIGIITADYTDRKEKPCNCKCCSPQPQPKPSP